jgi:hypothetical protein
LGEEAFEDQVRVPSERVPSTIRQEAKHQVMRPPLMKKRV